MKWTPGRIVAVVLVLGMTTLGVLGTITITSNGGDYAAVSASITRATEKKTDDAYAKLLSDIRSGLRESGVSPQWRDDILKRLTALQKRGLSSKKVAEAKKLIAQLNVGGETGAARKTSNCDPKKSVVFTHAFTDLEKIAALNPIGGIGGGSPGRSYIGVKEGMEAPIYAPMAATLRAIIYADRGAGYGEYGLIFKAGCNIEFMFDHIDRVSDKLKKYAPKTAAANSRVPGAEVNVRVEAGELLGYTNGTDLAHTFDFLVTNYAKKNQYLNPKRWEWEQARYSVCPYDFFTPELKAQYYAKLGKPSDTGLIKARACGDPTHDIAGTASGGWFKGTSTDIRGEYLAIARQYDEVMVAYRKDGDAFASREDVQRGKPFLQVTDMSPGKYPADIKPGDSICYSGNNQWAFIRLDSATQLSLAKGSGECPAEFPTSAAETWER